MWQYRHFVKENPKSGYDWSATGQWQTALCVCQQEHWECRRPCAESGRQSKNGLNREISCETGIHWLTDWLTDCTENNLSRSSANCVKQRRAQQLSETNGFADWLVASSCCKRYSLTSYGLEMKIVYRPTTIQLVERLRLCTSWYQEATHRSQPSATHVGYGVRCRVTSGHDWTDICQPCCEGERPVLLQCLAVSADASSNRTCRKTLFIHKTICCIPRNWSFFCVLWFPKVR